MYMYEYTHMYSYISMHIYTCQKPSSSTQGTLHPLVCLCILYIYLLTSVSLVQYRCLCTRYMQKLSECVCVCVCVCVSQVLSSGGRSASRRTFLPPVVDDHAPHTHTHTYAHTLATPDQHTHTSDRDREGETYRHTYTSVPTVEDVRAQNFQPSCVDGGGASGNDTIERRGDGSIHGVEGQEGSHKGDRDSIKGDRDSIPLLLPLHRPGLSVALSLARARACCLSRCSLALSHSLTRARTHARRRIHCLPYHTHNVWIRSRSVALHLLPSSTSFLCLRLHLIPLLASCTFLLGLLLAIE